MRAMFIAIMLVVAMVCSFVPVLAVEPDEVLKDAQLEARARSISSELRCMVCQNESIDASSAQLAKDLRLLVRERIVAGDSDQQVKDYLLARYGEFVLLRPPFTARNALLWLSPFLALALGAFFAFGQVRKRRTLTVSSAQLTPEEQTALEALLKDKGS